ncbi:MAG: hypothetical protein ACT4RN_02885 [Pseudonocardia sp.]
MPILSRIRSFLGSPQGRRLTDQGVRAVRNRGGQGATGTHTTPGHTGTPGHAGRPARGRGLLSSLLRRR